MTIADLLNELLHHDVSKQIVIDVGGPELFTNICVDNASSDTTTVRLDISR